MSTSTSPTRVSNVFFYGFFMDADLLRNEGYVPQNIEVASVRGFALRIGQRAALVRAAGETVYGSIMTLTLDELARLYSAPSLQLYKPEAVLAYLRDGRVTAALCYNLEQAPDPAERNADYAVKLRAAARKVGLPAEYLATLERA